MGSDNSNFIVGLLSAIALAAGLLYTFTSIHKTRLEIRKLNLELQKTKSGSSNKPSSHSTRDVGLSPLTLGLIIEVLFFLVFFISSVTTIVQFLYNLLPILGILSVQLFVLLYSSLLLSESTSHSLSGDLFSKAEQRLFASLSIIGLLTAMLFVIALGIARLAALAFLSAYEDVFSKLFSWGVNLAPVPLVAFSIVTLHRIMKYVAHSASGRK